MPPLTSGIIVELHLSCIFAQHFDVDLIPGVAEGGAGIAEEAGNHAVAFGRLESRFEVAVLVAVVTLDLPGGIAIFRCRIPVEDERDPFVSGLHLTPPPI